MKPARFNSCSSLKTLSLDCWIGVYTLPSERIISVKHSAPLTISSLILLWKIRGFTLLAVIPYVTAAVTALVCW